MKRLQSIKYIIIILLSILLINSANFKSLPYRAFPNDNSSKTKLNLTNNNPIGDSSFVVKLNGREYIAEYIREQDLKKIRIQWGLREECKNYNVIIDGHGTGFAPPSEKDYNDLIGKIAILDVLDDQMPTAPKASYDLSTEIYFPVVGDQQSQGSCGAWASVYYAYGYLEAKDHGWDASSGNTSYLMSPAWSYNKVAAYDYGSWMIENGQILIDWGCATLATMPYDDTDVDSWGDEAAWREAPYHRALNTYLLDFNEGNPDLTIDMIKSLIQGGTPVTFTLDAYEFSAGLNDNYIISSAEYDSTGLNHAQCIVGFDDTISEDDDLGAFRVVNSWGDYYLMDGGYYWLTYATLKEIGLSLGDWNVHLCVIEDIPDYLPSLIANWEFSSAPTRMDDIITLGVGPKSAPLNFTVPQYDSDQNNKFPEFMTLDISTFQSYYDVDNDIFFYLDIGPSIDTGTISSFLIERFSSGILIETTYESIDVPQSTPGYVRNTFMDFDHEISVSLEVPKEPEILSTYQINATVHNIGINDESDVELYLYLDGGIVDFANYSLLSSGTSQTIDYSWKPIAYNTYNFTVFSPSIEGEYSEVNNLKYSLVTIKLLMNYTMTVGHPYTWIDASNGTELFFSDEDYETIFLPFEFQYYDQYFSTVYLSSNGYLSFFDPMPYQYYNVPFPSANSLHQYMIAPYWDDLYPPFGGHIYIESFGSYVVIEWQDIYHIDSNLIGSFQVVLFESGDIVFNYDYINYVGGGYTCGLNLGVDTSYYNYFQGLTGSTNNLSILFSNEPVEHDIRVTLNTPNFPKLENSYIITAMVSNVGAQNESNINFYLYYDGILVNSTSISTLLIGTSELITYNWTPTTFRTYNFTVYAPPVVNETNIPNNRIERLIAIRNIKIFDGLIIDYNFNIMGYGNGPSRVSYSHIAGSIFHVDWQTIISGTQQQGYWNVDVQTRMMQNCRDFCFGNLRHSPFWIFPDASLGDLIPIAVLGETDHIFNVSGDFLYDLSGFGLIDIWILKDLTLPGGIAWYEKSSGILIYGDFYFNSMMGHYIFNFVDTNILFNYIVFDHDIAVYLETPLSIKTGQSYIINAIVKNVGLNDESDIALLLYLDEVLINSITLPDLPIGRSYRIQYLWKPTEYRGYNFTLYSPPIPFESYLENNKKSTIAYVIDTALFDGLYIKHLFTPNNYYSLNTSFKYTFYTSRLYYETWEILGMGSYTWIVDSLTRVMSGGSFFGDGSHTFAWILTNVSLYDTIPIGIVGEGDHDFYVSRDFVYALPGFGLIEVWELEDLTLPGGIAWYEKSTGILLNATFLYSDGVYNYSFSFVDTNANIKNYTPRGNFWLPMIIGLSVGGTIAAIVIPIVFVRKKRSRELLT